MELQACNAAAARQIEETICLKSCGALEVHTGFASRRVTRVLDEIIGRRGQPQEIRSDNGPELTSRHILAWALDWKIELQHIQPGRPTQNPYVAYCTSLDGCGKMWVEAARS